MTMQHKFVEFVPEDIQPNTLYVSVEYGTAVHKCCCGCGEEVVTPLTPTDWRLIFDGETVSLAPSIGNWSFKCRSHYFIRNNNIQWCTDWSDKQVKTCKEIDQVKKQEHYALTTSTKLSWWSKIISIFK
jgi:uncharacterized membrane-anchored protein